MGPAKQGGTKTRRTRSVGIKQDQNTAVDANALRGETDVCRQYPFFHKSRSRHADRLQDYRRPDRGEFLHYPPEQNRHCPSMELPILPAP